MWKRRRRNVENRKPFEKKRYIKRASGQGSFQPIPKFQIKKKNFLMTYLLDIEKKGIASAAAEISTEKTICQSLYILFLH